MTKSNEASLPAEKNLKNSKLGLFKFFSESQNSNYLTMYSPGHFFPNRFTKEIIDSSFLKSNTPTANVSSEQRRIPLARSISVSFLKYTLSPCRP